MGLHATASARELSDPTARTVLQMLQAETSPTVRIELAAALAAVEPPDGALTVLQQHLSHERPDVVLHAMCTVELLGERARPLVLELREMHQRAQARRQPGDMPMFIRFSLEATVGPLEASVP